MVLNRGTILVALLLYSLLLSSFINVVPAGAERAGGRRLAGENPLTAKAALIRYWENKISNKLPKPQFLLDKTSPLNALDLATFSKLAEQKALPAHLDEFCSKANLLCGQELITILQKQYNTTQREIKDYKVEPGMYFREHMLKPGTIMPMPDIRDKLPKRSFLPCTIASKLPFASPRLSDQFKEIFQAVYDEKSGNLVGYHSSDGKGDDQNLGKGEKTSILASEGQKPTYGEKVGFVAGGGENPGYMTSYGQKAGYVAGEGENPGYMTSYGQKAGYVAGEGENPGYMTSYGQKAGYVAGEGENPGYMTSYGQKAGYVAGEGENPDYMTSYGQKAGYVAGEGENPGYMTSYGQKAGYVAGEGENPGYMTSYGQKAGYVAGEGENPGYMTSYGQKAGYVAGEGENPGYMTSYGQKAGYVAGEGENPGYMTSYGQKAGYVAGEGENPGYMTSYGQKAGYVAGEGENPGYMTSYGQKAGYVAGEGENPGYMTSYGQKAGYAAGEGENSGYMTSYGQKTGYVAGEGEKAGNQEVTTKNKVIKEVTEVSHGLHGDPNKRSSHFHVSGIIGSKIALHDCARAPNPGEMKRCVGSEEDMIDFAVSYLGRNIEVRVTENTSGVKDEILIGSVKGINSGWITKTVICHQTLHPYLMYNCHSVPHVRMYEAEILDPATKVKINTGVALCHLDTSTWTHHEAFLALGSSPGKIEVCHWVYENDVAWVIAE